LTAVEFVTKLALRAQTCSSDNGSVRTKSEDELIAGVEDRLVKRFNTLPARRVSAAVATARHRFDDSTIRDFVPLLVERRVTSELEGEMADA
jgi:hypothetical protein